MGTLFGNSRNCLCMIVYVFHLIKLQVLGHPLLLYCLFNLSVGKRISITLPCLIFVM